LLVLNVVVLEGTTYHYVLQHNWMARIKFLYLYLVGSHLKSQPDNFLKSQAACFPWSSSFSPRWLGNSSNRSTFSPIVSKGIYILSFADVKELTFAQQSKTFSVSVVSALIQFVVNASGSDRLSFRIS